MCSQSLSTTSSVLNLTAFFVRGNSEELFRGDESGEDINEAGKEVERVLGRKRAMRDLRPANERGE
jgi:hypothetical protein